MIRIKDIVGLPTLEWHLTNKRTLSENVYRYSSESFIQLFTEARQAWRDGKIQLNEFDEQLLRETDIGLYGEYEGQKVPLDLPMLNEKGADTAWEDEEGNKVTLQDILDMTKNVPQRDYPTEKLAKVVLNWDDNPEEVERIGQVEISKQYPILIMVDEAGKIQWILDGNHRAQKALRAKAETIPAKLIKPSMLDAKSKKVLLGVVNEAEYQEQKVPLDLPMEEGSYEEGGEDDRKYALLRVEPRNYEDMIDKLQDMNINHNRQSDTVIKVYTDRIPDKVVYNLTHDVWVDKFVLNEASLRIEAYPEDDSLKKLLNKHNIKIKIIDDGGFMGIPEVELTGDRRDLEKLLVAKDGWGWAKDYIEESTINEAEYQGKEVPLNKPKRGGSKKFYVYVKNKKGNVQKVSFGGTTGLNVKIDEPGARSSFAARHQCATKKDKTKPGYWSCNIGRYWKSLGGSRNFSGYW